MANTSPVAHGPLPPVRPYDSEGQRNPDAPLPMAGDLISIRLPFELPNATSVVPTSSMNTTSGRRRRPHPCIVYTVTDVPAFGEWRIEVFICRSFFDSTSRPTPTDCIAYVPSLPEEHREKLIPLEPWLPGQPAAAVPVGYGTAVSFDPGFWRDSPSWVVTDIATVIMNPGHAVRDHPHHITFLHILIPYRSSISHSRPKPKFLYTSSVAWLHTQGASEPRARMPHRRASAAPTPTPLLGLAPVLGVPTGHPVED